MDRLLCRHAHPAACTPADLHQVRFSEAESAGRRIRDTPQQLLEGAIRAGFHSPFQRASAAITDSGDDVVYAIPTGFDQPNGLGDPKHASPIDEGYAYVSAEHRRKIMSLETREVCCPLQRQPQRAVCLNPLVEAYQRRVPMEGMPDQTRSDYRVPIWRAARCAMRASQL
jgi:hypothetical protein